MKKYLLLAYLWIFTAFILNAQTTPPSLTADPSATVDSNFTITFTDADSWKASIDSIFYNSVKLPVSAYTIGSPDDNIVFDPSQAAVLQAAGTSNIEVYATGFNVNTVPQTIGHGAATRIVMVAQPTSPVTNGGGLQIQPGVQLQDQYNNDCTGDSSTSITAGKAGAGNWTLGGTLVNTVTGGVLSYSDLTAGSEKAVTGAQISFSATGITGVTSDSFNIPVDTPPTLSAASNASVDSDFSITFTDDSQWRGQITAVIYGTDTLPSSAYTLQVGAIVLKPAESSFLQTPATKDITVVSSGYADAAVSQAIGHGVAANIVITTQPTAPSSNGGNLNNQPAIKLRDQYNNDCTTDNTGAVNVARGDSGDWALGGTTSLTVSGGAVSFSNLTASSAEAVTGAYLTFSSGSAPDVDSDTFNIPVNSPPGLTAASNATVDSDFEITFTDDATWRNNISDIAFGTDTLAPVAYDLTQAGKIVFSPSQSSFLQTSATKNLTIISSSYSDAVVSQEIGHGDPASLSINTQPTAPASNGANLATQPEIGTKDQYGNNCTTDNSSSITVAKGDSGNWTLGGTPTQTVSSGVLSYADLSASSSEAVTGAFITFSSGSLPSVNSNTFDIPINNTPGLTAASNATVDNDFAITFTDDATWRNNITEIQYGGNTLPAAAYDASGVGQIVLKPSQSALLQVAGSETVLIVSGGYSNASVTQAIGHGAPASLSIIAQPTAPTSNGGNLATQPEIGTKDQYGNNCTTDNSSSITAAKGDSGDWTPGGTLTQTTSSGILSYSDLSASSAEAVTGAFITFSSGSLPSVNSNTFDIPVNNTPGLTAASNATVDNDFAITFTDDATWRTSITEIQYGGNTLPSAAYDTSGAGRIVLKPSQSTLLQTAGSETVLIISGGYSNASVTQAIVHGAPASLSIIAQPTAPTSNGGNLATQPEIGTKDQYGNNCTTDNSSSITAAKGDSGDWTPGGTLTQTTSSGILSYSDLSASSAEAVTGAFITFSSGSLPSVNSNTFDIPVNSTPGLTAASNATVDNDFVITFTDDATWRTNISEIQYGGNTLPAAAYDASGVGQIFLKPSQSTLLQTAGSETVTVISSGYSNASVTQAIGHGAPASLSISAQPEGPASNGGNLTTQPVVQLHDQYGNICTTNNVAELTASPSGGTWNLDGTAQLTASGGVFTYTDLAARSEAELTTATITFSNPSLGDQESNPFTIPALGFPPQLLASSSATVDNTFEITFIANSSWQLAIDSITYGGNFLSGSSYDKNQTEKIVFDPFQDTDLQVAGTADIVVYSRGYENTSVSQEIKHGVPNEIAIILQPTSPNVNGGNLSNQPAITLRDQYGNDCSTENIFEITAVRGDANDWTLGGTVTKQVTNGSASYTDLTATSPAAVTGAFISFSASGLTTVNSNTFDIPDLSPSPALTAASNASVDSDFEITFTDNADWRAKITGIRYGADTLPETAYDTNLEGKIFFRPSESTILQTAANKYMVITSTSYQPDSIQQNISHGAATSIVITTQPQGPGNNGNRLQAQPTIKIQDQYQNDCTSNNSTTIEASATGGSWTLEGTTSLTVTNGVAEYIDLSARSTNLVSDATITFSGIGLTNQESDSFIVPAPLLAPSLTTTTTATVDSLFDVTFAENPDWQGKIDSISYGGNMLSLDAYNKNQTGKIVFDPSKDEEMQEAATKELVVHALGYENAVVDQAIKHGIADTLLIVVQPTGPGENGGPLAQQPELKLADQYQNDCTTDSQTQVSVAKYGTQNWQLGGTLQVQSQDGLLNFTDLTATSAIAIDSAYLQFYFDKDSIISGRFEIPVPIIELTAALGATVDSKFVVQASDNASWRDSISEISFAGETLADSSYLVEPGTITFYPEKDSTLHIARTDTIVVIANGYANAQVEQKIAHGIAAEMLILNQPIGPEFNGDTLAQQPKLQLQDQYQNNCVTDSTTQVLASKYSDGTEEDVTYLLWDMGGTKTITAFEGIVQFANLTAASENRVEGARILFTSDELPHVVSDSFNIVVPPPPVVTPATNANVDESFFVEFEDNKTWRSLISDIRYGIRSLEGNYDASLPGRITFDPSVASILQKSGVDSMYVYSGGYDTVRFEQPILHGKSKYLVIVKEPSPPLNNGGQFFRQPQLQLQDQYRNNCDMDNETPVAAGKGDNGEWNLSGTLAQLPAEGVVQFTDLSATSEIEVEGARLEFEGTGLVPKFSQTFTIPKPLTNRAGQAKANPELVCYSTRSTITLTGFDGEIQWQEYNELNKTYEDIIGETSEILVTQEIVANVRCRAKVTKSGLSPQFSNPVTISPMQPPVADFTFEIDFNQVHFTNLSVNATSVMWDFGDGIVSSELNPSHFYVLDNANGTAYVATLTASNQACDDSEKSQKVFIVTGIEEAIAESGLVVYPNPNRGEFFIELSPTNRDGVLRIYDQTGKQVAVRDLKQENFGTRIPFDLKALPGGLYFLSIQYRDKEIKAKLIVQ